MTFIFDWHFNKAPLKEPILLSHGYKHTYKIYIPMAQTYSVLIDFSKDNKSYEYLKETLSSVTNSNVKELPIKLYWEVVQNGHVVASITEIPIYPCGVSICFGHFKIPAGSYIFNLHVLEISPILSDFDTALNINYNFKAANTWQTTYIFWSMLFSVFIAPIIVSIIGTIFLVRLYRHKK